MESMQILDGVQFAHMIRTGTANLQSKVEEINQLNVFPIPDGDTGDNMLLTMLGGAEAVGAEEKSLSEAARRVADGMLLSARGNSGVILSQFFEGIAEGLKGKEQAVNQELADALRCGVKHAYGAVMEPTEGTMLTVMRCAAEYAGSRNSEAPEILLDCFVQEAKRTLEKTPEMLPVLKKAGVVDSGGAGLVYIIEGMRKGLTGEADATELKVHQGQEQEMDLSLFTEDSELEFGYCTELLLRLQRKKTDPEEFDMPAFQNELQILGDSIVAIKNGSIVKLHIHTMTPDKVLSLGQKYGEFLKVKIENMSLQHNNMEEGEKTDKTEPIRERRTYGVVAVASGSGVKQLFLEHGVDVIVDGGQSMNPSTEDFLKAFREVNADTVFVFPNNSNIILAAKQAADMYEDSDVRVIESKTIGDGYAALTMFSTESGDVDGIAEELTEAMEGVVTVSVSKSIRDTEEVQSGDYIAFVGKEIIATKESRLETVCDALEQAGMRQFDICILLRGKETDTEEAKAVERHIRETYRGKEVYMVDGMQEIYDYVLILE